MGGFPADVYQQLLGVDFRLIDELTYLSKQQRKRTGATYCMPGRAYLAAKVGCCIRTVSRSIARLKRLGILDAIQRRPVRGIWQTNLYRVRHWLGWRIGQITHLLRAPRRRGTTVASKPFVGRKEETFRPFSEKKTGEALALKPETLAKIPLLKTWMERGKNEKTTSRNP